MKKIILVIFVMLLTVNCAHSDSEQFLCRVISVHDGDTFTCADNTKIRIWGIDTPEVPPKVHVAQSGGYEARDFLQEEIINKDLKCFYKGNSYKRKVAQCFLNGKDIAVPLLKTNMAKEETYYSKGYYSSGI